jgi:hypothetical protein
MGLVHCCVLVQNYAFAMRMVRQETLPKEIYPSAGARIVSQIQFDDFFRAATTHTPFAYQSRLAEDETRGATGSRLISVSYWPRQDCRRCHGMALESRCPYRSSHRNSWPRTYGNLRRSLWTGCRGTTVRRWRTRPLRGNIMSPRHGRKH